MNRSFGWYFGQIRINPEDENTIYALGVELAKESNINTDVVVPVPEPIPHP